MDREDREEVSYDVDFAPEQIRHSKLVEGIYDEVHEMVCFAKYRGPKAGSRKSSSNNNNNFTDSQLRAHNLKLKEELNTTHSTIENLRHENEELRTHSEHLEMEKEGISHEKEKIQWELKRLEHELEEVRERETSIKDKYDNLKKRHEEFKKADHRHKKHHHAAAHPPPPPPGRKEISGAHKEAIVEAANVLQQVVTDLTEKSATKEKLKLFLTPSIKKLSDAHQKLHELSLQKTAAAATPDNVTAPVAVIKEPPTPVEIPPAAGTTTEVQDKIQAAIKNKEKIPINNETIMAFLSTVPMFQSLSDSQLEKLTYSVKVRRYVSGDYIIKQDDVGNSFYVIQEGEVNVRIRGPMDHPDVDGKLFGTLSMGMGFGERALLNNDRRAASIIAIHDVVCFEIKKNVFENVLSDIGDLLEGYSSTNDGQTEQASSLDSHIKKYQQIAKSMHAMVVAGDETGSGEAQEKLVLELMSAFSPELEIDDIIERMIRIIQGAMKVERIGLFVIQPEENSMILRIGKDARGIAMPIQGIAGHTAKTGEVLNIPDAYQDYRFDSRMDKSTGYITKQVLCVPIYDPESEGDDHKIIGVLQCINRTAENLLISGDGKFTDEAEVLASEAAEHLSIALYQHEAQMSFMNSSDTLLSAKVTDPFKCRISRVFIPELESKAISERRVSVKVSMYHGRHLLGNTMHVKVGGHEKGNPDMPASQIAESEIPVSDLPQATRIVFEVFCKNKIVGWAAQCLYGFDNYLSSDSSVLKLFEGEAYNPEGIYNVLEDTSSSVAAAAHHRMEVHVQWTDHSKPVIFVGSDPDKKQGVTTSSSVDESSPEIAEKMVTIRNILNDPFHVLSEDERLLVWSLRHKLTAIPKALTWFLLSVNYASQHDVGEAYQLLYMWKYPTAIEALGLLGLKFPDPKVRAYAVQCLERFADEELAMYMLQLVQAVRHERYHDSALSRFLLRRALKNPPLLGHRLFWSVKAEMHVKDVRTRYGVLLETYLRYCGSYRTQIGHQSFLMKKLENIQSVVMTKTTLSEKTKTLQEELQKTIFPEAFALPLDPNFIACGVDVEQCKVMSSARKPLYLVFKNSVVHAPPLHVMYKHGDDLRQDELMLQLIGIMDYIWRAAGLDMRMTVYGCIATGENTGLIEIVQDSKTIGGIVMDFTKLSAAKKGTTASKVKSAFGAMDSNVLLHWLVNCSTKNEKKAQKMTSSELKVAMEQSDYKKRTEMFWRSVAGYCVATYVLGIGDRHNDNIMVKKSGQLFHIDYGHIFGNFKKKYGVKRERAMFVFTPAFARVIGGKTHPDFIAFTNLACRAYNLLRENSVTFFNLCSMMVTCEIEELSCAEDFEWMHQHLLLRDTPESASAHFEKLIFKSLKTRTTQWNDAAHMIRHA